MGRSPSLVMARVCKTRAGTLRWFKSNPAHQTDRSQSARPRRFTKENIEVAEYARENLEDMTADNTVLFTEFYHRTAWAIAVLEYESDTVDYNKDIINTTNQHNIKRALRDKNIKYIIRLDPVDAGRKAEFEDDLKQIEEKDNMEIIFKNDTGYIAKINR